MDIDINTLQRVLYSCLELHNYFELQKKKTPEQNLALALNFVKGVQTAAKNLSFKRALNEKKGTYIRNNLTLFFK